jgi:hypothetical protein
MASFDNPSYFVDHLRISFEQFIPIKASKNHRLTGKEKAYNRRLAGRRVVIEHINAWHTLTVGTAVTGIP